MKVGIAGFAGSGKSTVFHWLSGEAPDPSKIQQGQLASVEVPDARLDWLSDHFKPKKTTPAKLELLDTPGLLVSERKDNARRLGIMRDAGALLIVINGFADGNAADELKNFRDEMIFADLEIVAGRIERVKQSLKKPRSPKERDAQQAELVLLERINDGLESGKSAAELGITDDEEKAVRSFQLLTLKPEMVLLNVGEDRLADDAPPDLCALSLHVYKTAAQFDLELAELPEEERAAFAADFLPEGVSYGSPRDDVLRSIFYDSGHTVFFTVGTDECRAWTIPKGATAVEGAGAIHTDLQRGFVRGEVVTFDDFQKVGSMKEAKNQGVYRLEGKTYVLADGDIMHVLAST